MLRPLTDDERAWVEATLASMTPEERVGHLLCPEDRGYTPEAWRALLEEVPLGSVFFGANTPDRLRACLEVVQATSRIPVLVASDLEHGAGALIEETTTFPWPTACGATNDPELAHRMGRATAREGRAMGIHWTFSPVVDLNVNSQNPVTNIRALGDNAAHVAPLASALIEGLQASGELGACAKHFPGDGVDDRDQHICTTINALPLDVWWRTYGRVWQAAVDSGVYSVMAGHIAFPAYAGLSLHSSDARPATLSRRLQVDLLRGELGFDGVLISDAAPMVGISSRISAEEKAVQNILAGSDVFLFAEPRADFVRLLNAVRAGRISENRLEVSVRRVLEMKARLGLHREVFGPPLLETERAQFRDDATAIAEQSITLVRANALTPMTLTPGARVLTVTVKYPESGHRNRDLYTVDAALRARGFAVDHLVNPPGDTLAARAADYACVFVNIAVTPHSLMGTMRLTGDLIMPFWNAFWVDHPNVVFTSFGSPYHLYELPHLPNLYLAYGPSPVSQEAAVRVWLGEIEPRGVCPVRLCAG